jgi:hypothetical protein
VSEWQITETQLYDVNTLLQRSDNVLVNLFITRTAQESKLFPVLPYINMCMTESYYRYPDIVREITAQVTPEEIGHWAREVGNNFTHMRAYCHFNFYLLGRANLIRMGLIRPEDNLEDLWLMCDWWNRMMKAFNRERATTFAADAANIAPLHAERTLQVFEADAIAVDADPRLRAASAKFIATATQYNLLAHCECRLGLHSSGPYAMGGDVLMHVRHFTNLAEGDFSWLDDVASDVPYANLVMPVITKGVGIEITDFGSAYTTPEDYQSKVVGVGLYASDSLSERHVPVGMGSAAELADTFEHLTEVLTAATRKLYKRISGWNARQRIDAGLYVYFQGLAEPAHMAGVFRHEEWEFVDERNNRLRGMYNEEFALDSYVENWAALLGPQGSANEYYLHPEHYQIWRKAGQPGGAPVPHPGRQGFMVSSNVLRDHDYSRRVNPNGRGDLVGENSLPAKTGLWRTSQGDLTQEQFNEKAKAFRPKAAQAPWVHIDDQWVKWNWQSEEVNDLYRHTQEGSRLLAGRGASLRRTDLDKIRLNAGEPTWQSFHVAEPGQTPTAEAPAEATA